MVRSLGQYPRSLKFSARSRAPKALSARSAAENLDPEKSRWRFLWSVLERATAERYSVGKPDGASPFLDSILSIKGAGALNLPGKWNMLASSSLFKIKQDGHLTGSGE